MKTILLFTLTLAFSLHLNAQSAHKMWPYADQATKTIEAATAVDAFLNAPIALWDYHALDGAPILPAFEAIDQPIQPVILPDVIIEPLLGDLKKLQERSFFACYLIMD